MGASLEFESFNENPAWKFEAAWQSALHEGARRRTAGERVGAHRAALRLEFESLRAWSLKPSDFES